MEEVRDLKSKNSTCGCWLEDRGDHIAKNECGTSLGAESSPWMTASKETWASVLEMEANEFCQQQELEGRLSYRASTQGISPIISWG